MNFKFNVNISDADYFDFNFFVTTKSQFGKKQNMKYRIYLTVFWLIGALYILWRRNFSQNALPVMIVYLTVYVIFQLAYIPYLKWWGKRQIKSMKKNGILLFSPTSTIEFYDDFLIETTPESRNEQKYTSIDRVSIIEGKAVYLHINNVMACILPMSCFGPKVQYDNFIEFVRMKFTDVKVY